MTTPEASPFLLEASWEVCNKVGGIYTVITSKFGMVRQEFKENYLAIGPFLGGDNSTFKETPLPENWQEIGRDLATQGIILHFGHWLIQDKPEAILIDWQGFSGQSNHWKGKLWEKFKLDSLGSNYYDIDQPLMWAISIGLLTKNLANHRPQQRFILQTHEWMTGGAILALKSESLPANVTTVFTTHATVLGRALSSRNSHIYENMDHFEPEKEARAAGVLTKHQIEALSAQQANIFTTVSKITGHEASIYLGRQPDVITENGLDVNDFPVFDQLVIKHAQMREQLEEFITAFFLPFYYFEASKASLQFTMGRYEPHNKGYDLYLESLGELNKKLQKDRSNPRSVVSFFLVPADVGNMRPQTLSRLQTYQAVHHYLGQIGIGQEKNLLEGIVSEKKPEITLDEEQINYLRQLILHQKNTTNPELSPYFLNQGDKDEILRLAKQYGLENKAEDKVKILFFPIYFDGFDGVFNTPFYDLITGFDLGVFPSFYEPWGYTPMESLAAGVPAISSNLAGFGQSAADLCEKLPNLEKGIWVIDRQNNENNAKSALTSILELSLTESDRQWVERRMAAYELVQQFNWQKLYQNYQNAYQDPLLKG